LIKKNKRSAIMRHQTNCLSNRMLVIFKSLSYIVLGPNIRFLPSIVAEKNATKNEHICSMWRKINKVGKQSGVYCFTTVRLSVHPRYFSSHFSQQLLMAEIWYLVTIFNNYSCNQYLSPLTLWVWILLRQ
jgi:hypothetical protein